MRATFSFLGRNFALSFISRREYKNKTIGYTNATKDGMFIPVLDYDHKNHERIRAEIERLQRQYCLGDFHIFETIKGYHAVCFDKVTLDHFIKLIKQTTVDPKYIQIPLEYGARQWTLRFSHKNKHKPRYCGTLNADNTRRTKSTPHINLLNKLYPTLLFGYKMEQMDNHDEMMISTYNV